MAWKLEKNGEDTDIVIDGFEKGVADSAEEGIGNIVNMNIISVPKECQVGFATSSVTIPPAYTSANGTFNDAANTVTYSNTNGAIYAGVAMTFSASTGGVTANVIYWAQNVTATTFKLYNAANSTDATNLVDLTDGNVHVFTTLTLGAMKQYATDYINNYLFFQDSTGACWWLNTSGNLIFIGPVDGSGLRITANSSGNGLAVWAGGGSDPWLFAFRDAKVDVMGITNMISSTNTAIVNWNLDFAAGVISYPGGSHYALSGRDNALYFCNKTYVGRVISNGVFDAANSATYFATGTALTLPSTDRATVLSELDINLLIGGVINAVYIWNRTDTNFNNRLILAENNTTQMVNANSNVYIFAGNRGRIYITNGSNVQLFRKFPDQISTRTDPYWTWGGAIYWKNQLYFGITATTNAGGALSVAGGVWAIDLDSNALRQSNSLAGATVPVIAPNIRTTTPGGAGFYAATTISTTYALSITSTDPYTDGTSLIDSDLIPVGTYFKNKTFKQIEFKLSKPLVSGESIEIQQRPNMGVGFSAITGGTFSTAGDYSGSVNVDFEKYQWLQLRALSTSIAVASSPSLVRLTELRIR